MYANENRGYFGGRGRLCWRLETEGQETRGMGFNGIPWGGGRGQCWGGGHGGNYDSRTPASVSPWAEVENLRKKVEELETRLAAQSSAQAKGSESK